MVFNRNKNGEVEMKLAIMFPILLLISLTGYAQNTNTVVVNPKVGDDVPASTIYSIGDTGPAGGIVSMLQTADYMGWKPRQKTRARK